MAKMVASVRHFVLKPEDASRSIHECAALLGLPLASEIPLTTILITGMSKTVASVDILDAFDEFGEISEAAVATYPLGFGILRFRNPRSIDLALKKYKRDEIVVQDVPVEIEVLQPNAVVHV